MKWLGLALALLALPAAADLYRWVDPATGSVKFSSLPPSEPGVPAEVVPYNAPPKPAASSVAPSGSGQAAELESRWRSLLMQLVAMKPEDFTGSSDAARQRMQAYEAVRIELDRLDPAGAARRAAEAVKLAERQRSAAAAK